MPDLLLAANGLPDLYALLEGSDPPALDFVKCPLSPDSRAEVRRARAFRPVLLHGWGPPGYSVTLPEVPEPDLLRELAATSGTPYLSVHLDHRPARDGELTRGAALARARDNVERLRDLSGLDVLLENVPHYAWQGLPRWATEPAFVAEALDATGTGLLVDLAHARVAARHRGEDVRAYVAALPLERAVELHVSGPREEERGLMDRHLGLLPEDRDLLEWTLPRVPNLRVLTHEYSGVREATRRHADGEGPEKLRSELAYLDALRRGPT